MEFSAAKWRNLFSLEKSLIIKQLTMTLYHPMCNGVTEKFNGTMKSVLKRLCSEQPRQWHR